MLHLLVQLEPMLVDESITKYQHSWQESNQEIGREQQTFDNSLLLEHVRYLFG